VQRTSYEVKYPVSVTWFSSPQAKVSWLIFPEQIFIAAKTDAAPGCSLKQQHQVEVACLLLENCAPQVPRELFYDLLTTSEKNY
jgi:hypothetical protein